MIPVNMMRMLCSFAAVYPALGRDPKCAHVAPKSTPELRTFTYSPAVSPGQDIPQGTPLQFNGSYPGQGDVPGQLGWWTKDASGNTPVDLISFVQYNADSGVVFWAERTRFEVYMSGVKDKTYAVKLGQPGSETPQGLAGNWTITKLPKAYDEEQKYAFGWEGDYENWFTCKDNADYYGLYFGEKLDGCGDHFVLNVDYEDPSK